MQLILERLHDILKDREEVVHDFDPRMVVKSVLNRERRKVHREIYQEIMKNSFKDSQPLNLSDDMKKEHRRIVEQMNDIKKQFLDVKTDQIFVDVMTGQLNSNIMAEVVLNFKNMDTFLGVERFMIKFANLYSLIANQLDDIINFK